MEALEAKILEVEHFRDSYYRMFPDSSSMEKARAVREKVLPLIQDIPLDVNGHCATTAQYNYICGRILNIMMEYDANCERHLVRAVKLDPTLSEAWFELGECNLKKRDFQTAVDCLRTSLSHKRSANCLSSLAKALRQNAVFVADEKLRFKLQEEATQSSVEAVRLDPQDGNAWHALGNSYITQFFLTQQKDFSLMEKAQKIYEKALQLGDSYYSPDLHLNYSTALKYSQNYADCLKHMKIAAAYDPEFSEAKEQMEALYSFLRQISVQVKRKGKLSAKKLQHLKNSISDNCCEAFCTETFRIRFGRALKPVLLSFRELKEGVNKDAVISGRVVAVVPNPETIPYTFIGCDKEGYCYAFTVYNFSNRFGVVVGDSIAVPEPYVTDVKIPSEDVGKGNLEFRIVRISDPMLMSKNGRLVGVECVAYCKVVTDFIP